jgi:hypothetical protein
MPIPWLHLSLNLGREWGTNLCGSAGRDLCRATREESLEVAVMPSNSNPRPLLSSNNKGHQAPARHNQPLGMRLVMPMSA